VANRVTSIDFEGGPPLKVFDLGVTQQVDRAGDYELAAVRDGAEIIGAWRFSLGDHQNQYATKNIEVWAQHDDAVYGALTPIPLAEAKTLFADVLKPIQPKPYDQEPANCARLSSPELNTLEQKQRAIHDKYQSANRLASGNDYSTYESIVASRTRSPADKAFARKRMAEIRKRWDVNRTKEEAESKGVQAAIQKRLEQYKQGCLQTILTDVGEPQPAKL
jgi:hypothetical protein